VAVCIRGISFVVGVLALWTSLASARNVAACLTSAEAVRQEYPGAWPSWTLRAAGQEGTKCWYPSTRAGAHDHRSPVVSARSAIAASKAIEQDAATEGFDPPRRIAPPLPSMSADVPFPAVPLSRDVGDESAAAGSFMSERIPYWAERSLARDDPGSIAARATQEPAPSRQSVAAASAPDENEHLPLRTVLLALIGALMLLSVAGGFLFRSWGDTSLYRQQARAGRVRFGAAE
jgi:hypothetical protein